MYLTVGTVVLEETGAHIWCLSSGCDMGAKGKVITTKETEAYWENDESKLIQRGSVPALSPIPGDQKQTAAFKILVS